MFFTRSNNCSAGPGRRWGLIGLVFACAGSVARLAAGTADIARTATATAIQNLESEYLVDSWQTEQGLPDNFVNAIAQTPDGYLWIATFNGLARFNGVEFVVFDAANTPELPSSRITKLHCDHKGRLWITSEYGDLTQRTREGFKSFTSKEGLPKGAGDVVSEDHEGEIWVSNSYDTTNYFHFAGGIFRPAGGTDTIYRRFGRIADAQGYGWGIRDDILFCPDPHHAVREIIPNFKTGESWRLTPSREAGMWVIASHIQKFREGHFEDFGPIPAATDQFEKYLEDRDGNLWVGTGIGELWRIGTNHVAKRFKFRNSTTMELGRSIFEDAEGNLWIGNGGDGLVRLKPRAVKTFDSRDGLASDVVRSVTEDREGNVWLATVNSVDWFRSAGGGETAQTDSLRAQSRGLPISLPWRVYGSHTGAVWIGTYGEGLFRLQGDDRTWFKEPGRGVSGGPPMNVLFEDRQGQPYIGTPEGLYTIKDNSLVRSATPKGLQAMDVRALAEDRLGELYVGSNGQGLLRKTKKDWDRFTTIDGLPDDHVAALHFDSEDALWIGTESHGLSRFKNGRFFNFAQANVDVPRQINCILEDDVGHLWFGSNQGLFRADWRRLNELADRAYGSSTTHGLHSEEVETADSISVTHYGRSEGMGSGQCTGEARKTHNGILWFATMRGITVVDPHSLPLNTRPPPVLVEGVSIDDVIRPFDALASSADPGMPPQPGVTVPRGSHRLEIRYAGLSFTAPDRVRFRYRLDGFDKDWVKAGSRRTAYYTKVPPGAYHFQVLACNNDNVWNETGAALAVVVMPQMWQTGWFRVTAILCGLGFALGLYELRVLQLKRQKTLQESFSRGLIESQEKERKRIAAELHDGLGQNLLVVKNYAAMALREPKLSEKTQRQLQEISNSASASVEEVRSIARALRPYQLDRFGLTKTLEDAAELVGQAGDLQIRTEIDNVDGIFSTEAEISIYRVVQEWLNNVVKHSRAGTTRLRVRKDAGMMRMILEDDGCGFEYETVMKQSSGLGLANLGERARLLGGTLKIETAPGKGTRLNVDIPCKK